MRSRAALLPFVGDPFLLHYWLHFYDTVWAGEVDRLYIYFNSTIEQPVVDYINELIAARAPKVVLLYSPTQKEHGDIVNEMLDRCEEDLVMLIEDDGFIFKQNAVNRCFEYLESGAYDIVASKRGSCSSEISVRARELWGLSYEGEGDQGCNFWPNFFFTRKAILKATDRNFAARSWKKGEVIEPLGNYVVTEDIAVGDTFVNTSLQLHAAIPEVRIMYVPQYHGSPDDLDHAERQYNLFDGIAPWCHIGSLSSGVGGILQDGKGRALTRRLLDPERESGRLPNYCNSDGEKREWERRIQWWLTFYEKREPGILDDFAQLYYDACMAVVGQYELNINMIQRRQNAYARLGL